jgi:hypothetical protein
VKVTVIAFEAFEHFVHLLEKAIAKFEIGPNILFSTNLIANPTSPIQGWSYHGLDHGHHMGFTRMNHLEYLA